LEDRARGSDDDQLSQLVCAVLKSPKYRNICEELIENIGQRELSKRKNLKAAIKSTKSKLHRTCGAYFLARPNYELLLEKLRTAQEPRDSNMFRAVCAEIMGIHHSTRQRLEILDQFYTRIFSLLPPVHSIMDLACGFNPLSIPWMPIKERIRYYAYDVYKDMMAFLNEFFRIAGIEGHAEVRDVIQYPPEIDADLALIMSSIPCLEQIHKSAGFKILESVNADYLTVSFPTQSLGGRDKDFRRHYERRFTNLVEGKDWDIQRLEFDVELAFVIRKNPM